MFEIIHSNKTAQSTTVYDWFLRKDQIDFSPSYQRIGGLWSTPAKQLLIDSIINKLDLPKFYIHYSISSNDLLNENGKMYAIIDGKQRFESIFGFINDEFPLSQNFKFLGEQRNIQLAGLKYSEILNSYPDIARDFESFELDVIQIVTDEKERIEELFLRLNEGQNLVNAEKRYALSGYMNESIRRIVNEHNLFISKVAFADKRYDYFDIVTRLISLEYYKEGHSPFSKVSLDLLLKDNRIKNDRNQQVVRDVETGLDFMDYVFTNKDELLDSKNIIPLYYQFTKTNRAELDLIRDFLVTFSALRSRDNKVSDNLKNIYLTEFNRLNQQGTTLYSSFEKKLTILNEAFKEYKLSPKDFSMPLEIDGLQLEIDFDRISDLQAGSTKTPKFS